MTLASIWIPEYDRNKFQLVKTINDYFTSDNPLEDQQGHVLALTRAAHTGLRFMLTRISRYNDLLELELENNPAGKIYLDGSNLSLQQSERILEALEKFIRTFDVEHESIDLRVLIHAAAKRLNHLGKYNLKTDLSALEDKDTFVQGNLALLQDLFLDLPDIFGSPVTGSPAVITIKGELEKFDKEYFGVRKSELLAGEYIKLSVALQDQELSANDLVSLYEKQVLSPETAFPDALLFIYGTVREHRGDMFFRKNGDTIESCSIVVPVQRNKAAMYADTSLKDKELKGTETVLLVDDEDIIWDVVIDMLQKMGYTVILASNGRECVEIYESNPGQIDLILLDMVMPEMNGHDAFFRLKEIDSDVKVLLSSGYVDEKDAQDVLAAGAAGFLRKPYRMVDLARRIRAILDG